MNAQQRLCACRPLIKHTYLPTVTPPHPPLSADSAAFPAMSCSVNSAEEMLSADAASRKRKLGLLFYQTKRPLLVCGPWQ